MLHPVVTEMSVPRLRGKGPLMGDKHGELSGALK
ncbi:response regulator, partial [Cutibacterium acnes subsp. acnes]|nr:response regulator [Cutibacterium acnes subsp. acnes]